MVGIRCVVAAAVVFLCVQVGAEEDSPPRTLAPIRPRKILHPITPRVAGPACGRPLPKVVVPPGGTVTVSYPSVLRGGYVTVSSPSVIMTGYVTVSSPSVLLGGDVTVSSPSVLPGGDVTVSSPSVLPGGDVTVSFPSVLPGGDVSVSSPSVPRVMARAATALCGWAFQTDAGQKLSISCKTFSLTSPNTLVVTELGVSTNIFRYAGKAGPSSKQLATNQANVAFKYDPAGTKGSFTCDVTASGGAGQPAAAPATPPPATSGCRCGIVNRASRIVGGTATGANEYPWQVGLITTYSKDVFCGATVISDKYVLTAAHCTADLTTTNFRLLLGAHSTAAAAATEIIVKPIKIMDNPSYNKVTYDNDMSIIEIAPINFNDPKVAVRPICLPDSTEGYAGTLATVTGWGTLKSDGAQPLILQEVQVPVVSAAACKAVYGSTAITARMLCAGTEQGGKDSCQGDSGGPLIAPDGANYELIGVVSFGSGCGDPGVPGVYARVTALQSWIASKTAGSTTCGR